MFKYEYRKYFIKPNVPFTWSSLCLYCAQLVFVHAAQKPYLYVPFVRVQYDTRMHLDKLLNANEALHREFYIGCGTRKYKRY